MTALLVAALSWPALAVALGILGGRLLRRAEPTQVTRRPARPARVSALPRLPRRDQALASSGSKR
jgi:hypothetical protein